MLPVAQGQGPHTVDPDEWQGSSRRACTQADPVLTFMQSAGLPGYLHAVTDQVVGP